MFKNTQMNSYQIILHLHSGIRWIAFLLVVVSVIKSLIGLYGEGKFTKFDNILGASFVGTMHLQFLLGITLYVFLSPATQSAFQDFGAAMKDISIRFWAVEHITAMIVAVVMAQLGRSRSKKAATDAGKFKVQSIFYGISFLFMMLGIPWFRLM